MSDLIGSATIEEHLAWCENELTPPIVAHEEVEYVVRCFQQSLKELRSAKEKLAAVAELLKTARTYQELGRGVHRILQPNEGETNG